MTGYLMSFIAAITWLGRSFYRFLFSTLKFFQEHKVLSLMLFLSFMMKYFLAGWNSYWLDELYSVYERGILFNSAAEVLHYHQQRTSGMPLYEFILFNWMQLFGHTEVATRTLSIIYVTLATLFLYLFTLKIFGRRVAIFTTLLFTFSYIAVYYSLESRYYGQTLFLCTLSSYLLLLYLKSLKNNYSLKKLLLNKYFILLAFSNVALMLTFPFNYFFLAAQGLFVLFYFLYQNRQAKIIDNCIKVFYIYMSQLTIMGLLWNLSIFTRVILIFVNAANRLFAGNDFVNNSSFSNNVAATNGGQHFIPFKNPITIFIDYVVEPNFNLPSLFYSFLALMLVYALFKYGISFYRRDSNSNFSPRKIYIFYLFLWTFLPCLLVYFLFSVGQLDKLHMRYLVFCTPPLIVLLAITLEQGVCLFDRFIKSLQCFSLRRHYIRYSLLYAIIVTTLFTLPGGYAAATYEKENWRGIANQIVQQIHRDTEHEYIVIETAWRKPHVLDYYFKRFSDQVRVYNIIRRTEEGWLESGEGYEPPFMSTDSLRDIEAHDYLILTFTHHTINHFPQTEKYLSERYILHFSQLDEDGRGYLVFSTQSYR